jgi:ABC-type multidrug transport system ATPase subunit
MKKRLGIAITLLNDPKIIILDEPTAGLDPKERVHFRNLLSELSVDRIVLLSTHIISDIEYIAKEIIMIDKGELIRQAKPDELLEEVESKVWNYKTIEFNIPKIESMYRIGNILRCEDGVVLRIISDKRPFENAVVQKPVLEDVYLYFFGEEAMHERAN